MDFLRCKKKAKKTFVTFLGLNEQDIAVRTCKKVEYTPSKLYENKGRAVCMACLYDLQKQQVIDQKIYDQKLMEDTVRKLAWDGPQKIL